MKTLEFKPFEKKPEQFGVFETIKISKKRPLRLNLHYERMRKSCIELGIGILPPFEEFEKQAKTMCLNENNFLKITALKSGIFFETGRRKIPEKPVKLAIIEDRRVNSRNPLLKHKTTDYQFFQKITEYAEGLNCYDGVILNEKGNITQTGKCNIYFKKGNSIITPPLQDGLLPGTIRRILVDSKLVKEKSIPLKAITQFEECFVSNALIGFRKAEIINLR